MAPLLGRNSGIGAGAFGQGFRRTYFPMEEQKMRQQQIDQRGQRQAMMDDRYAQQLAMQGSQLANQERTRQANLAMIQNPQLAGMPASAYGDAWTKGAGGGADLSAASPAVMMQLKQMAQPKAYAPSEFEKLLTLRQGLDPKDPRRGLIDQRLEKMSTTAPTTAIYTGDVGDGGRPIPSPPEKGMQDIFNPQTQQWESIIKPGGSVETKAKEATEKTEKAAALEWQNWEGTADTAIGSIDKAILYIAEHPMATGYGSNIDIKGSPAYVLDQLLLPVRSKVALGNLGALKKQSATGASGFGALSEKELAIISGTEGSFDPGLPPEMLIDNLKAYSSLMKKVKANPEAFGFSSGKMPGTAQPAISMDDTADALINKYMPK